VTAKRDDRVRRAEADAAPQKRRRSQKTRCAPDRIRTCDPQYRKLMLYPLSYGGLFSLAVLAAGAVTCQAGAMSFVRRVACELDATLSERTSIVLAVAVAPAEGLTVDEHLDVQVNGLPVEITEVVGPGGTRWHTADVDAGTLRVRYSADVTGRGLVPAVSAHDRVLYVRPSRYVQSDELAGPLIDAEVIARLAALAPLERIAAARDWVAERMSYVPGSTMPTDGLPEVLATNEGVCRDYAHVVAGLLRATDLPARVVSVYAPQLEPMDFHAVVEAAIDDEWVVIDATGLAPREGMLRIATGRDAADTAFLANDGEGLELLHIHVEATSDTGFLERPTALVTLG